MINRGRITVLVLAMLTFSVAAAQAERIEEQASQRAIVSLWESLVPLQSVNSFMNTGAHPDDERSSLLAYLSRGVGARVINVTANRGEGGQNAIGTEYLDALGVVRSREMEEASEASNQELFFLSTTFDDQIYDFGFSKTPEETFSQWGEEETVERLVRAIRTSRPDVMFTSFLDVYGQHGHHRAMTQATLEAYDLAADPNAFPEQLDAGLQPWAVKKLYLPAESGAGSTYADSEPPPPATLTVEVGRYDPILGATYTQLGEQSRVYHQSQGMGDWEPEGPASVELHLLRSRVEAPEDETSVFGGMPQTLLDLSEQVNDQALVTALTEAHTASQEALNSFPAYDEVASHLVAALTAVRDARTSLSEVSDAELASNLDFKLSVKETQLERALEQATLLIVRLEAERYTVTRGDTVTMTLSAYRGGETSLENIRLGLVTPDGWTVQPDESTGNASTLGREETVAQSYQVTVSEDAALADPYTFEFDPAEANTDVYGTVEVEVDGVAVTLEVAPESNLAVLPDVTLSAQPEGTIYNTRGELSPISVDVSVTNNRAGATDTTVRLDAPESWQVEPAEIPLTLEEGSTQPASFTLTPAGDVAAEQYTVDVIAEGEAQSQQQVQVISYDHIGDNYMITPAQVEIQAFPVTVDETLRVGYVDGGSDTAYEALRQLGLEVTLLDEQMLSSGDLSQFDTIVLGIFAYRTRPDLAAANDRVLAYVEGGGNLVSQYHRPWDNWNPETTAPYFLEIGSPSFLWRVTDETAEVEVLEPNHALLNVPNTIAEDDWEGWVKDRGLYFASDWDERYTPLFAMNDAGEEPLRGSLLTTEYGAGRYTHTSLIYYFQLDNLVPGAYRMMANLVTPPQDSAAR